jgi:hypothetical protein
MKKLYPYLIPDQTPYHRESIPVYGSKERIEFFYKYKRPTENLYIGNIDLEHLALRPVSDFYDRFYNYFHRQQYLDETVAGDITKRLFPKICWLADSLFKTGFKYPVMTHYNPRTQTNVVHPGSIRSRVANLFQQNSTINCLYFNTGGVDFDFIKSLRVFKQDELLNHIDNIEIELVADHGSIIPHINLDVTSVQVNVKRWQEFVYRRLTSPTFTINRTAGIDLLSPWYVDCENTDIEIRIDEAITLNRKVYNEVVCTAMILAVIGKSYSSELLTVTHKHIFETPGTI